ncbi:hypothetical protein D3C87_1500910 [compost metagenome]
MRHEPRAIRLGQRQRIDRLGCRAHRWALGEGTGQKTGGKAGIEIKDFGNHDSHEQPGHTDDDRKQYGLHAVPLQRLQELWPDRVADAEEEQEEQERFRHAGNRDIGELSDQDARKQRAGNRPEAEATDLEGADQISDADRKEDRKLGIFDQELLDPNHVQTSPPSPRSEAMTRSLPPPNAPAKPPRRTVPRSPRHLAVAACASPWKAQRPPCG